MYYALGQVYPTLILFDPFEILICARVRACPSDSVPVCVAVRFKILHVRYLRIYIYACSNLVRQTLDQNCAYFQP